MSTFTKNKGNRVNTSALPRWVDKRLAAGNYESDARSAVAWHRDLRCGNNPAKQGLDTFAMSVYFIDSHTSWQPTNQRPRKKVRFGCERRIWVTASVRSGELDDDTTTIYYKGPLFVS